MHLNLDESNELLILDGQIIAICWLISAIIIASGVEHKHIFETTNQTISAFSEASKQSDLTCNTHDHFPYVIMSNTSAVIAEGKTLFLTYR